MDLAIFLKYTTVFFIALIPALIWLYLFLRQYPENRWLVVFTFIGGMIAAKLILVYQGYWDETINFIFFKVSLVDFRSNIQSMVTNFFLATFAIFLGVGVMEEIAKFWIMKLINRNFFRSIDDVIELAIVSALGFVFFENIMYFISQWGQLSPLDFILFASIRATVLVMVHVLCSGVLGYYYGMAHFASPVLAIEYMKRKKHTVLEFLKQVLHLRRTHVYHDKMILIGLVLAMFLHAIYDFITKINLVIVGIPLFIPITLLYFFGGFWFLSYLLKKKKHQLKLGLVGTRVMSKRDFAKIIDRVRGIQEARDKLQKV